MWSFIAYQSSTRPDLAHTPALTGGELPLKLEKLDIPYLVTGGLAVVVWGRPRFTADVDIVIELKEPQIASLAKELLSIGKYSYVNEEAMQEALIRQGEFNFIHPETGLKIDFWILKNELHEREKMERRIQKEIAGELLYFISPEDLILSKLQWYSKSHSDRHLEDIESILRIQKNLDFEYLQKWATIQSTITILEDLLQNNN